MNLGTKTALGYSVLIVITLALGAQAIWSMEQTKRDTRLLADETVPAVKAATGIEKMSSSINLDIRSYGYTEDEKFLQSGLEKIAKLKEHLQATKNLVANAKTLSMMEDDLQKIAEGLNKYEKLVQETKIHIDGLDTDRKVMTDSAAVYATVCNQYLSNQYQKMDKLVNDAKSTTATQPAVNVIYEQIQTRIDRIQAAVGILDLGNQVRIGNLRAQTLRDPDLLRETQKKFIEIDKQLADLKTKSTDPVNITQIEKCQAAANAYNQAMSNFLNNWLAIQDLAKQRLVIATAVSDATANGAGEQMQNTADLTKRAADDLGRSSKVLLIGQIAGVVLSSILAYLITRSITRPVVQIAEMLTAGSQQTSSAASQVSTSSQALSQSASQQAALSEETTSSVEEIRTQARQAATLTEGVASMMKENIQKSGESLKSIVDMTKRMAQIEKDSQQMTRIIKTIDEIAFQTNLLALNAAVEAARAGESGRGFAVVAEEVRALASRSAKAAKDTQDLLEGTAQRVRDSAGAILIINKNFESIVETATMMGEKCENITKATSDMAHSVDQISSASEQASSTAQSVAATSEETSAAAEELTSQATELDNMAGELRKLVYGALKSNTEEASLNMVSARRDKNMETDQSSASSEPNMQEETTMSMGQ